MKAKKIILAGGTGFLGKAIINRFSTEGTEIIVLSRGASHKKGNVSYLQWDGASIGPWSKALDGADVLINLTGKSVDCRYTEENKKSIISSRVNSTRVLGEAISLCNLPPKVWLNSASATIYRAAEDKPMDEFSGEIGEGFSEDVCKIWEKTFNEAIVPKTRKITLRITMILGKGGGVIPVLRKLVNAGLGGQMGNGKQYISWLHEEDFLSALEWLIDNEKAEGAYNLAAPEPVPNADFMRRMRRILNRSIGLPASKWMLEIGAFFMRTETELILKSRRVVPTRLLKEGFVFKFPAAEEALKSLLK
ncbi:MAG: TIGR01777 family oxidoreductase [Bacteroidota bacterium]|nr:TIGR01777 family oxidoreductase [Bacteroidota bacterium]